MSLSHVIFTLILFSYEYTIKQKIVDSITCMCKTIDLSTTVNQPGIE